MSESTKTEPHDVEDPTKVQANVDAAEGSPTSAEAHPTEGAQPNAGGELEAALTQIESLKAENADLKDQLLRKAADFDNYRKRILKEKEEAQKFSNSALLQDLVQVLDDFERAIRSSEQGKDFESFHSGIVMIESQFASMLERKYNLKRFESVGLPFQPDLHEAISMEPKEDGKETIVVEEYQKGYQLHERVIRTAKVKVGHAKDGAANSAATGTENE